MVLLLVGCRDASSPAPAREAHATAASPARPTALAASEKVVSGIVLPEGLEPAYEVDDASVFVTQTPVDRVFEFFAAGHPDARMERIGAGGVLRAVPVRLATDGGERRVDVAVLGRSRGGALVRITLLPEVDPSAAPTEEQLRQFVENVRHLD